MARNFEIGFVLTKLTGLRLARGLRIELTGKQLYDCDFLLFAFSFYSLLYLDIRS